MTIATEKKADHVKIFDTTLRDGEQAPGFSMATEAKLIVARALRDLQVDIIEAGFAAASPGDAAAVRAIAEEIDGPVICSLARLNEKDIDASARAIEPASAKRIHTFIGTSPLHREAKLKLSKDRDSLPDQRSRSACEKCLRRCGVLAGGRDSDRT